MTRLGELLRDEGKAEGRAEGKAEAIVLLLSRRFGVVPRVLVEAIRRQQRDETLEDLVLEAATVENLEEFSGRFRTLTKE